MPKKRLQLLSILALMFVAFLALYFLFNSDFYPEVKVPPEYVPIAREISHPIKLIIPSLNIEVGIQSLGLTETGTMEAPEKPMDTGWFVPGPVPGELGSAVIAGHRGWKIGPAIFDNLHQLKVGEEVIVLDELDEEYVFRVRELRVYEADEIVPEVWNKNDAAYLNLITCSGDWNALTGASEKRLVVFTDLVK